MFYLSVIILVIPTKPLQVMKILNKSENNNKVVYKREQAIIKLSYYDCLLGNMIANYDIGHGLYIFN